MGIKSKNPFSVFIALCLEESERFGIIFGIRVQKNHLSLTFKLGNMQTTKAKAKADSRIEL